MMFVVKHMEQKDTLTFWKNGARRVKCPYCHKYVGRKGKNVLLTKLDHKTYRACTCCHCGEKFIVYPPVKTTDENGVRIIKWGPDLLYTTADLTEKEFEDTIPM